jgi:hypothetical protein
MLHCSGGEQCGKSFTSSFFLRPIRSAKDNQSSADLTSESLTMKDSFANDPYLQQIFVDFQPLIDHYAVPSLFDLPCPSPVQSTILKAKAVHNTPMVAQGVEWWNSSYSFTTSALDGGEWSASRPGRALPPGKRPPVPIGQEARWAPEPVWTQMLEEKSSLPPPGIEPRLPGRPVCSQTL